MGTIEGGKKANESIIGCAKTYCAGTATASEYDNALSENIAAYGRLMEDLEAKAINACAGGDKTVEPVKWEVGYIDLSEDIDNAPETCYHLKKLVRIPISPENKPEEPQQITNCKNCGAPLTGRKCEYCGTIYNFAK